MIPCLWYRITGLYCPGCGLQRAIKAFCHGDLKTAIHMNAFIFTIAPLALIIFAFRPKWFNIIWVRLFIVFIFIAFGILRNIRRYPFSSLAPY